MGMSTGLGLNGIRALATRMLAARGEGPRLRMSEERPPEMVAVMASLPMDGPELPVLWSGEVWYRAWPYEDGRWHWWFEEFFSEWRPLRFADGALPKRVGPDGREEEA